MKIILKHQGQVVILSLIVIKEVQIVVDQI